MGKLNRTVADGGTITGEDQPAEGDILGAFGAYRWVVWFLILEAILLVLAVIIDVVLGNPTLGGIFAAFTVLIGAGGIVVLSGTALYKTLSKQE